MDLLEFIKITRDIYHHNIAFTNGVFDIIHPGHIDLIKKASEYGTLIVGLNSDKSIQSIPYKKFRPINNEVNRKIVVESIRYVGFVEIFNEETPLQLIKKIKPDVLIKGQDWNMNDIVGKDFVNSYGGSVISLEFKYQVSTTRIIKDCWKHVERKIMEEKINSV